MARRKTNEEFIKEVYNLVGNKYEFLEEYKGAKTKIKCRHNRCGYEWQIAPSNFLSGQRCPQCMRPNYNRDAKQFKKEIYNLVGDEYIFLEEYVNNSTKILCRHNSCGYEWHVIPSSFLRGTRCPKCSMKIAGQKQSKTHEEFLEEIYELVGDEYVFLEEYKNNRIKIKCRHNKCGHKWLVTPSSFLSGSRCPKCMVKKSAAQRSKTDSEFKREAYELVGEEYTFLEDYINNKTKILCRHNKCGYEWKVYPNNILKGCGCLECSGVKKYTYLEVKAFVEKESSSGCKLLSKSYANNESLMLFKCSCGEVFQTTFSRFKNMNVRRCNKCGIKLNAESRTFKYEDIKNYIEVESGSGCKLLSDTYTKSTDKLLIQCKCGAKFNVSFDKFKSRGQQRCKKCASSMSKGEERTCIYLESKNIDYETQYIFDNLLGVNDGLLRFDFYLPNYDLLIEYDGEQHYRPVNFGGIPDEEAELNYKITQQNDNIKNQYCKDNNIPLLRIPYWEFDNIEQILEEWLEKHGVLHKNKKIA